MVVVVTTTRRNARKRAKQDSAPKERVVKVLEVKVGPEGKELAATAARAPEDSEERHPEVMEEKDTKAARGSSRGPATRADSTDTRGGTALTKEEDKDQEGR